MSPTSPLITRHVLHGTAEDFGWLMGSLGGGAVAGGFAMAAATLVVVGFSQIMFQATCNTILQLTAPDALRGRIMSLYALVFTGVTPFGALAVGYVAEQLATPAACAAGGAGGFLSVAMLSVLWRRSSIA